MTYMKKNLHFFNLKKTRYGRTDRRTDGPTDRPSYRDARTHLKMCVIFMTLFNSLLTRSLYSLPLPSDEADAARKPGDDSPPGAAAVGGGAAAAAESVPRRRRRHAAAPPQHQPRPRLRPDQVLRRDRRLRPPGLFCVCFLVAHLLVFCSFVPLFLCSCLFLCSSVSLLACLFLCLFIY